MRKNAMLRELKNITGIEMERVELWSWTVKYGSDHKMQRFHAALINAKQMKNLRATIKSLLERLFWKE